MSLRNHFIFWILVCIAFIGVMFLFKSALLPFVLGIATAYLLNPVVNKLGTFGLPRGLSVIAILSSFLVFVVGFFLVVSPIIYDQLVQFSKEIPNYVDRLWAFAQPYSAQVQSLLGQENAGDIESILRAHSAATLNIANVALTYLASGSQSVLSAISVIVFMPIVAYFMMKEWPHIINWMNDLMPRDSKKVINQLLSEIDTKLSAFVRGQISVAFFLGIAYAIALSIAGLKYGFLIGLSAGLLSVIPMVGSIIGLLVAVIVAFFQSGDLGFVALIAGIFVLGQLIEGNILTPKIVGKSVGLHPLWIFFALLVGGGLFGILGMLIAVPVAAVIGVLLSFAIAQYKQSPYYKSSKSVKKKPARKKAPKKA